MIAWMRVGRGRRGLMGLALLALWLKVMLPPGFMPAASSGALLTICTGLVSLVHGPRLHGPRLHGPLVHGPLVHGPLLHGPLGAALGGKVLPAGKAGQPCAFAGHAISPPGPPTAPMLTAPRAVFLAGAGRPERRRLLPGRRLAAPPPPAQAPPVLTA